ncbi:response regulator transcription factor [Metasolibacillus sp. FSL K6-0083]|uniref:response regulator transcription factor n=1 Tax=Metasolibacillus sp. FSL K6-0083 TaxID=2921416 RepID=UPI00315AC1BA
MNQKILIVEDDLLWCSVVSDFLQNHQYDITIANSAEEAMEKLDTDYPCMILLDLLLPGMSGEAFCEWVRNHHMHDISIIMMSSKHTIEDKINGLKMGADDYLVKPINLEELLAHIEAVLRRTGLFCQKIINKGLCIKPRKGEVLLNGKQISLTKHEFMMLYYFMNHPNIILSREDLITHLYPNIEREVLDRTIDAHIKKLRLKIENDPKNPTRIITVRGLGYKYLDGNQIK